MTAESKTTQIPTVAEAARELMKHWNEFDRSGSEAARAMIRRTSDDLQSALDESALAQPQSVPQPAGLGVVAAFNAQRTALIKAIESNDPSAPVREALEDAAKWFDGQPSDDQFLMSEVASELRRRAALLQKP